ncbi:MAG: hypothetical protein Edafosvirus18_15 [Edafosvirus sp.]|uniref:Uncharacterized protein n=1 Tax=Edafosvirus sp. TaxID=2487765 RepID=A0A3G4ZUI6_9VIRU|nr:MAG: hypothetical protein Edafosvirus18_15 [Edafosvirus sp.]
MLIIIYGKMASGKSYIGKQLSSYLNFSYYDGDDALSTINKKIGFVSKSDVKKFVSGRLIPAIESKMYEHKNLVVSQALYFEEHRNLIRDHFTKIGENVIFIQVNTPEKQTENQSWSRGIVWWLYGKLNNNFFESSDNVHIINNISHESLIPQFKIFSEKYIKITFPPLSQLI